MLPLAAGIYSRSTCLQYLPYNTTKKTWLTNIALGICRNHVIIHVHMIRTQKYMSG